jgi:hypothetical protein
MSADTHEIERLLPPDELAEHLLDAAAVGRFSEELAIATRLLEERQNQLDSDVILRYQALFFDLSLVSTTDRRVQAAAGVDLLSVLDDYAWDMVLRTSRIDDLRRLIDEPELGLDLIELLTYAPDAGIHDFATAQLEAIGMQRVLRGEDARSIERLLHAAGARDGAYRLESARKHPAAHEPADRIGRHGVGATLPYRAVAIVGGHSQLRASAAAVLDGYGVRVVSIPSSQEAVRRERAIMQSLQGCDLAMLLVRQITHSTSDQVRKAAERLGVPVLFSNAASAVAIERQLLDASRTSSKG